MIRSKPFLSTLMIAALLALAALNSFWGSSEAQTVPTKVTRTATRQVTVTPTTVVTVETPAPGDPTKPADPTTPPGETEPPTGSTPGAPAATEAQPELKGVLLEKYQFVPREGADINLTYEEKSAGIIFEAGYLCNSGIGLLSLLAPDPAFIPNPQQMTFFRPVTRVVLFVQEKNLQQTTCGELDKLAEEIDFTQYHPATNVLYTPYFDLDGRERFLYDSQNGAAAIFWYNPSASAWEPCENATFDPDAGVYGRLSCQTSRTGLFAFGSATGKP